MHLFSEKVFLNETINLFEFAYKTTHFNIPENDHRTDIRNLISAIWLSLSTFKKMQ